MRSTRVRRILPPFRVFDRGVVCALMLGAEMATLHEIDTGQCGRQPGLDAYGRVLPLC